MTIDIFLLLEKFSFRIGIGLILFLITTSCAYYPHLTDVPLINKKGDTRFEGGIAIMPGSAHATVSYGLTEKIAVQGAGGIGGGDGAYYLQGAAGYYKNLQNKKVIEMYGGFGYGYGQSGRIGLPGHLYGNHQLYFAQFNYGKINGSTRFGLKSGYLHANLIDDDFYSVYSGYGPYNTINYSNLLLEPVIVFQFGKRKLKCQTTIGACWMFKLNNTARTLPHSPLNISLGLNYSR